jgi:folate-binding protein YgfZ
MPNSDSIPNSQSIPNSLSIPGAVPPPTQTVDSEVAWHFGDPFAEQRKLISGDGSVDQSHRGVISITGADAKIFLNSLTTQELLNIQSGESAITLDLNPQGFVQNELHVIADDETLWITTESNAKESLLAYLQKMKFRSQIEIVDATQDFAVVWQPKNEKHEKFLSWISPFSWSAREILVPRNQLLEVLGDKPSGMWAYEALRVEALVPRIGFETDHRTIPHEVGWIETAVHLNKGCYRGQETVSKVERMGKPPRRLVRLLLDGSSDQMPGSHSEVTQEGAVVGFVGQSVHHAVLGPIASAVIKRNVEPNALLQVSTFNAVID